LLPVVLVESVTALPDLEAPLLVQSYTSIVPEPPVAVKVKEVPWHTDELFGERLMLGALGMATISAELDLDVLKHFRDPPSVL
jgi:hypothetical protein